MDHETFSSSSSAEHKKNNCRVVGGTAIKLSLSERGGNFLDKLCCCVSGFVCPKLRDKGWGGGFQNNPWQWRSKFVVMRNFEWDFWALDVVLGFDEFVKVFAELVRVWPKQKLWPPLAYSITSWSRVCRVMCSCRSACSLFFQLTLLFLGVNF